MTIAILVSLLQTETFAEVLKHIEQTRVSQQFIEVGLPVVAGIALERNINLDPAAGPAVAHGLVIASSRTSPRGTFSAPS